MGRWLTFMPLLVLGIAEVTVRVLGLDQPQRESGPLYEEVAGMTRQDPDLFWSLKVEDPTSWINAPIFVVPLFAFVGYGISKAISITEIKKEINELKDNMLRLVKELETFAKRENVDILRKYIDLWSPVNFVTKNEVEDIVRETIDKLRHGE